MTRESRETVGVRAEAIIASRDLVAIPSLNPPLGLTLELIGFAKQGWVITITDAMGSKVWEHYLNGLDPVHPDWPPEMEDE
jgi:hypothetical protein